MLSFELSAMDLILAVAVIILLILYLTKSSTKPPTEEKLFAKENSSTKPTTETTIPEEKTKTLMTPQPQTQPQTQTGFARCLYGFGYLKKLDKQASIPDECLGCSRITECCSANE